MAVLGIKIMTLTVRGRPLFRCDWCADSATGMTVEEEKTHPVAMDPTESLSWLSAIQARSQARSASMPVGWASFYHPAGDKHKCPDCLAKERNDE